MNAQYRPCTVWRGDMGGSEKTTSMVSDRFAKGEHRRINLSIREDPVKDRLAWRQSAYLICRFGDFAKSHSTRPRNLLKRKSLLRDCSTFPWGGRDRLSRKSQSCRHGRAKSNPPSSIGVPFDGIFLNNQIALYQTIESGIGEDDVVRIGRLVYNYVEFSTRAENNVFGAEMGF